MNSKRGGRLETVFLFFLPATQEEQHRLKQELASLAITLNMEAQKRRVQVEEGGREHMRTTTKEIMVGWVEEEREGEGGRERKRGGSKEGRKGGMEGGRGGRKEGRRGEE